MTTTLRVSTLLGCAYLAYVDTVGVSGPGDDASDGETCVTGVGQLSGVHRLTQTEHVAQHRQLHLTTVTHRACSSVSTDTTSPDNSHAPSM